jgi:hypothetical protein
MRLQKHIVDEGIRDKAQHLLKALKQEGVDSKHMMKTFFDELRMKLHIGNRQPTEDDIKKALTQLKDVGKLGVIATLFLAPAGTLTVPVLEKIANKYGTSLFPDAFRRNMNESSRFLKDDMRGIEQIADKTGMTFVRWFGIGGNKGMTTRIYSFRDIHFDFTVDDGIKSVSTHNKTGSAKSHIWVDSFTDAKEQKRIINLLVKFGMDTYASSGPKGRTVWRKYTGITQEEQQPYHEQFNEIERKDMMRIVDNIQVNKQTKIKTDYQQWDAPKNNWIGETFVIGGKENIYIKKTYKRKDKTVEYRIFYMGAHNWKDKVLNQWDAQKVADTVWRYIKNGADIT